MNENIAISPYKKSTVALFAFFLGCTGFHRFYVDRNGSGAAMLIMFLVGVPLCCVLVGIPIVLAVTIWSLTDLILVLCDDFRDSKGRIIKQ